MDPKVKIHVSVFTRYLWEEPNLLLVTGNFGELFEGQRLYDEHHNIPKPPEDQIDGLRRTMAACGLAALSVSERESWGWTFTVKGSTLGYFCGVEPEGMVCGRIREAPVDRGTVYLQRSKGEGPMTESHYDTFGSDPAMAVQRYFEKVDQTRTRLVVGEDWDSILVHALPDGDFDKVADLDDQSLLAKGRQLEADGTLKGLQEVVLFYECRCDDEMILKMISSLGNSPRAKLWGDQTELEVECPRCGRQYTVTRKSQF